MKTKNLMVVVLVVTVLAAGGACAADRLLAASARSRGVLIEATPYPNSLPQTEPDALTWTRKLVDAPPSPIATHGDHSLQVDASGRAHVVFGGDLLYYATGDGLSWQQQIVDPTSGVGSYASLALDSSGNPRISYFDNVAGDLKYAARSGADWATETVDSPGQVGMHTSLALDAAGQPHIAYYDRSQGALKYAYRSGSSWVTMVVDASAAAPGQDPEGMGCSLALTAAGDPRIAYFHARNADLNHARWSAGGWQIEVVADAGLWPSLALDDQGRSHISFSNDLNVMFSLAHATATGWQIEAVTPGFGPSSLALDSRGFAHVGVAMEGIKYLHWDGAAWQVETLWGSIYVQTESTSLALGPDDRPSLLYSENTLGFLEYFQRQNHAWQHNRVVRFERVGGPVSLALDSGGQPHIGYLGTYWVLRLKIPGETSASKEDAPLIEPSPPGPGTPTSPVVKYAHRQAETWSLDAIDGGFAGYWVSMKLDRSDQPHLIYFTWFPYTEPILTYTHKSAVGWQREDVTVDWSMGSPSLALDLAGEPRLVYDGIEYAWKTSGQWQFERIADDGDADGLALDAHGAPHVSYQEPTQKVLAYARRTPAGWAPQVVDPNPETGYWSSLQLDADGNPRISYHDGANNLLKYASWTGASWVPEVVEGVGATHLFSALALDRAGNAHICYQDNVNEVLKYARQTANGWQIELVDNSSAVGRFCSLAVEQSGRVFIAYTDSTSNDLKLASGAPAPAQDIWRFRGYTYQGQPGDRSRGLGGVRLWLYGRNEGEPPPGRAIESKTSDGSGFFNFYVTQPPVYDIYRLTAELPGGMAATGVWSEDGTIVDNLTVEWVRPRPEVHLNEFYFDVPTATPTATPTSTHTASATPSSTFTPTPSLTATPTPTPTHTATASSTPTPTETVSPTVTLTSTPSLYRIWTPLILTPRETDCTTQTDLPPDECETLVALYHSTNGPHWIDGPVNGWTITQAPCRWYGVTCSPGAPGHVTRIDLPEHNLTGTLPDLSALTSLTILDLSANRLTGSISDLAALPDLYFLALGGNELDGPLPNLALLPSLRFLSLLANHFSGSIDTLASGANLVGIDLGFNDLSGSIPDLTGLTRLEFLVLEDNEISGVIPSFSNLDRLYYINLENNQLSGAIPGDLPSHMVYLLLGDNQLSGSIPDMAALTRLRAIHLQNNRLSGVLPDLSSLDVLESFRVQNNQLHGAIPAWVCAITMRLEVGYNLFTGAADPCVTARDPAWADTQTAPPANVLARRLSTVSLEVSWTPISYTGDGGHYEVLCSQQTGGPYTSIGTTAATGGKSASALTSMGLSASTPYYCVVRSFTPRHGEQQNDLTSIDSDEVMVPAAGLATGR